MKLHIDNNLKYRGPPILISYKTYQITGNNLADKLDSLKVYIKMQPWEKDSETVAIYVPLFLTGSPEALLNYVTIFKDNQGSGPVHGTPEVWYDLESSHQRITPIF